MGLMSSGSKYDGSKLGWKDLGLAFAAMDFDYLEDVARKVQDKATIKRLVQLSLNMLYGYDDAASDYIEDVIQILIERGFLEVDENGYKILGG